MCRDKKPVNGGMRLVDRPKDLALLKEPQRLQSVLAPMEKPKHRPDSVA
jgi:hypothetical protein